MAHTRTSKLRRPGRRAPNPNHPPGWADTLRNIAGLGWGLWIRDKSKIQTGIDTIRARVAAAFQDLVAQNLKLGDQLADYADRLGRAIDQRNQERARVNELENRVADLDQIVDDLERLLRQERADRAQEPATPVDDDPFLIQRPFIEPWPWNDPAQNEPDADPITVRIVPWEKSEPEPDQYWYRDFEQVDPPAATGEAAQTMARALAIIENPA